MNAEINIVMLPVHELAGRIRAVLATSITPTPWDMSGEIGVEWWSVRRPDGAVIVGFEGVGLLLLEPRPLTWSVAFTVAEPHAPGANERRAWLQAAIATFAGPDAIVVDGARLVRRGEA